MNISNMINELINKYNAMPCSADVCKDRHLNLLMNFAFESKYLDFDGDAIIVINAEAPFHRIEIERITGAEDFGSFFGIFLPAAAVLIDKAGGSVKIAFADEEI